MQPTPQQLQELGQAMKLAHDAIEAAEAEIAQLKAANATLTQTVKLAGDQTADTDAFVNTLARVGLIENTETALNAAKSQFGSLPACQNFAMKMARELSDLKAETVRSKEASLGRPVAPAPVKRHYASDTPSYLRA